jgi:hypothetical protein
MADQALDFLTVVDVAGREDRIYVFAENRDAERFADAINGHREYDNPAFVSEQAINVGDAAERLIASERGDVLEELGWPAVAEDVRKGKALVDVYADLIRRVGESRSVGAPNLIRRWLDLDSSAEQADGGLPDDVKALIAATFRQDADTIEAPDSTWERLRALFPASLAPRIDEDGIVRIGGHRG